MFEGIFSMRHVLSNEQIRTGMMHFRKIYCIFELDVNGLNWTFIIFAMFCYLFDDLVEARGGRNTKFIKSYTKAKLYYTCRCFQYTRTWRVLLYSNRCQSYCLCWCHLAHLIVLYRIKSFWWPIIFFPKLRFRWNIFSPDCWFKHIYFYFQRVENELFKIIFNCQMNKTIQRVY